jgi:hypothetical protein
VILPSDWEGGVRGFGAAQAPAVLHSSLRPICLVGLVGPALHLKIRLNALRCHEQALAPRAPDGIGASPATLLELALALAQPALPPLDAGDDLLGVQFELQLIGGLGLGPGAWLGVVLPAPRLLSGPSDERAPALRRGQPLGQLIAAGGAVKLVLGGVDAPRLGEDLSAAICS